MLSGAVLKQFRTYLKSQVGHGWSVEGRKSKGRLLNRVSFRYLNSERSVALLEIDFDTDNLIKKFIEKFDQKYLSPNSLLEIFFEGTRI